MLKRLEITAARHLDGGLDAARDPHGRQLLHGMGHAGGVFARPRPAKDQVGMAIHKTRGQDLAGNIDQAGSRQVEGRFQFRQGSDGGDLFALHGDGYANAPADAGHSRQVRRSISGPRPAG
ncbi:MAG: hypothetical protein AB9891_06135 [Anaerolineaceae bacterium]